MRKSLVAVFVVLLLVSLVSAVDWTPQGDINLRNIYGIESVTTINITGFLCFNESCFNATNLSASTGGDMTTVIGSDGVQGGATSGVAILYTNWTRHNEVYINNSIFNRTVSESVNYTSVDGNLSIDSGSNVITWLIDLITKASELANDMGWVNSTIIQGWIGSNSTADRTYTDDSISSNITALDIGQYATNTDVENNVTVLVARDDAINDSTNIFDLIQSFFYKTSQLIGYNNLTKCSDTQILKMSGTDWVCGTDSSGSGAVGFTETSSDFLYNTSQVLYFNDILLNSTIDARGSDTDNPFDQSLNTTDTVTFGGATINGDLTVGASGDDNDVKYYADKAGNSLMWDANYGGDTDGSLILDYSGSSTRAWNAVMPGIIFKQNGDALMPGLTLNMENNDASGNRLDLGWGGANGGNFELYSKNHDARAGQFRIVYGGNAGNGHVQFTHYNGASWIVNSGVDENGRFVVGLKDSYFPGKDSSTLDSLAYPFQVFNEGTTEIFHVTTTGDVVASKFLADDWTNATITESQVSDLLHINNCSVSGSCDQIFYQGDKTGNDTTEIRTAFTAGKNITISNGAISVVSTILNDIYSFFNNRIDNVETSIDNNITALNIGQYVKDSDLEKNVTALELRDSSIEDGITTNITALDIGQYASNTDVENNATYSAATYYLKTNPENYYNSITNFTGTLTNTKTCIYTTGTGIVCDTTPTTGTVTSVTGSTPIVSSEGSTPAISITMEGDLVTTAPITGGALNIFPGSGTKATIAIPKATSSVDGYLDNADWTTFNNKADTDTTYSAGNGISLSTTTFSVAGNTALSQDADGLSVTNDAIGDTQLAFNTGQALTTTSNPTFDGTIVNEINMSSCSISYNATPCIITKCGTTQSFVCP